MVMLVGAVSVAIELAPSMRPAHWRWLPSRPVAESATLEATVEATDGGAARFVLCLDAAQPLCGVGPASDLTFSADSEKHRADIISMLS